MEINYIQNILSIRDKLLNKDVTWNKLSIQKIITKYSNTNIPVYKMIIDEKVIPRNNSLLVKYKCLTCEMIQEITLNLYMRKVNREGNHCVGCVNKDETKRESQSKFMKEHSSNIIAGGYTKDDIVKVKNNSLETRLKISKEEWELEDDDFKDTYFHIHLTIEDFERIRSKIIDIGNGKITDLSNWKYEPCYRVYNQTRYTPMLINSMTNQIEKPYYITFCCENCESKFTNRDIEITKNKIKLFCKDCSFVNKIFCIRKLKMKNGENINWQSVYERRFIEWCEEQNISIKNGPTIPYLFEEKQLNYRVDFELPIHKKLIELKDDHCWHKKQVETGKFAAKENIAKEWAEKNGYTYHVVFPKNISEFKNLLTKTL